jgi:hypothetical protein
MGNCCCCVSARELVSKKKKRTIMPYSHELKSTVPEDGVNLDLVAVHPRIVAMGFPATGVESWYRNPYEQVKAYLDLNFASHYTVYNLCAEKQHRYDTAVHFDGRVKEFPFFDHFPCPLAMIPRFVEDCAEYLDAQPVRVVAIHCKAGKGRTGLMACCLMMRLDEALFGDADAAVKQYGEARTKDGKGLTHRSQIRYVQYYARLQKEMGGRLPEGGGPRIHLMSVMLHHIHKVIPVEEIVIRYIEDNAEKEIRAPKGKGARKFETVSDTAARVVFAPTEPEFGISMGESQSVAPVLELLAVKDDVRIELHSASGKRLGSLCVHTLFLENSYNYKVVDKIYKSTALPDDARIDLVFHRV